MDVADLCHMTRAQVGRRTSYKFLLCCTLPNSFHCSPPAAAASQDGLVTWTPIFHFPELISDTFAAKFVELEYIIGRSFKHRAGARESVMREGRIRVENPHLIGRSRSSSGRNMRGGILRHGGSSYTCLSSKTHFKATFNLCVASFAMRL